MPLIMLSQSARALRQLGNPAQSASKRFSSTVASPKRGPGVAVPLAIAGVAGAVYYCYYRSSVEKPVAATSKRTLTNPNEWMDFKLAKVTDVNHNTKLFTFELPERNSTLGLVVNSCILTMYKGPTDEKPIVRPYTPISDVNQKGTFDLLIKKYVNGPMSTHMHDMAPGQLLKIRGPIPKYKWEENKHEAIGLIAGGTGITPMYQLIKYILSNPKDKTKISLVYGSISEDDILLKRELAQLENKYPQQFKVFYVLDNPPPGWKGGSGYITEELLKATMPKEGNVKIFVCGPPKMYDAISGNKKSPTDQGPLSGILRKLGYTEDQVYKF